jgi:hypothetical protein
VASEVHSNLRVLFALARRIGQRLSAILNLHWNSVDFAKSNLVAGQNTTSSIAAGRC